MKAWNMPMALDPPPTHATTESGSRPTSSSICARACAAPQRTQHELEETPEKERRKRTDPLYIRAHSLVHKARARRGRNHYSNDAQALQQISTLGKGKAAQ
eukprot:866428-Pleurochrysis_carterae.AAC.1